MTRDETKKAIDAAMTALDVAVEDYAAKPETDGADIISNPRQFSFAHTAEDGKTMLDVSVLIRAGHIVSADR